jgi:hypothetical protein
MLRKHAFIPLPLPLARIALDQIDPGLFLISRTWTRQLMCYSSQVRTEYYEFQDMKPRPG